MREGLPSPLSGLRSFAQSASTSIIAILAVGAAVLMVHDPSDLSTMFTDNTGTTQLTAPGQSVGLILDKGQGLVLGPERVTNGTFPTDLSGWTLGVNPTAVIATWTAGGVSLTRGAGSNTGFEQTAVFVPGNWYRIVVDVVSGFGAFGSGVPSIGGLGPGINTRTVFASGTTLLLWPSNTSSTCVIRSVTVKLLPGYHASQPTAASRPVYGVVPEGGRRNLLTYTEDFSNAAWTKVRTTITANAAASPSGATDATLLTENTDNNTHAIELVGAGAATPTATIIKASIYVKANGRNFVALAFAGNPGSAAAFFDIANETVGTQQVNNTGASITGVGNGWYYITIQATTTAPSTAQCNIFICNADNSVSYAGNGTSGIYIWHPQVELGSTATAYQRVVSAFDVTEAGVQTLHYLQFDGADDFLVTGTITPGVDKVQVIAGVRKLSDAAAAAIAETSVNSGSNAGAFAMFAPSTTAATNFAFRSGGTLNQLAIATPFAAPITSVLTGIGDISGDVAAIRLDGVLSATTVLDQGTGNFLAYPMYIGRRGGTTLPLNGLWFGQITRFSAANLDQPRIDAAETYMGGKTGIAI